jgi:hypothetical protein
MSGFYSSVLWGLVATDVGRITMPVATKDHSGNGRMMLAAHCYRESKALVSL